MLALRLALVVTWTLVAVTVRRLLGHRRHPEWSWRLEVVALVARWAAARTARFPVQRVRAALPPARLPRKLAARVIVRDRILAERPAEEITPRGWRDGDPVLLWLHGGGYVFCSSATHRELAARIACAACARTIVLDYRLAPEHPFPAALEDAVAAFHALLAAGIEPARLLLGGDSAGGGLSLATMVRLRDADEPLPAAAILLSPWVDLTGQGDTIAEHARYDYIRADLLASYARDYLGDVAPEEPEVSPLHADLHGLPPLLVHTGGAEALRWENETLVERARAAGVSVSHEIAAGLIHVWHGFARFLPQARHAIRDIGEFVRARFDVGPPPSCGG